jgi:cephalosporin hydroxylase
MDRAFEDQKKQSIRTLGRSPELREASIRWIADVSRHNYSYNFCWMGLPIIQFPQDIVALQEIVWEVKPELIIETGIARGGSLIFHASMLELLGGNGRVLGIDVEIREANRCAIEAHPMARRIMMVEGSSTDPQVVAHAADCARGKRPIMVVLDSNHTHDHVLGELRAYSPLVTCGSYLVVLDTIIEDLPADYFPDRPWSRGRNAKTAVWEFLRENDRFTVAQEYKGKLLITVAPDGYLKCVKD